MSRQSSYVREFADVDRRMQRLEQQIERLGGVASRTAASGMASAVQATDRVSDAVVSALGDVDRPVSRRRAQRRGLAVRSGRCPVRPRGDQARRRCAAAGFHRSRAPPVDDDRGRGRRRPADRMGRPSPLAGLVADRTRPQCKNPRKGAAFPGILLSTSENLCQATTRRSRRLALRSKNSAWLRSPTPSRAGTAWRSGRPAPAARR